MTDRIITLSSSAADRIKKIMSSADKETIGVRIGVKSGGCAGMSYVMEYAKTINPNEEVIEDKGVKVLIDPKAIIYLIGTEMDYKQDKFSSQFVFKNPNETERCGCGESFKAQIITGCSTSQTRQDEVYARIYKFPEILNQCRHLFGRQ